MKSNEPGRSGSLAEGSKTRAGDAPGDPIAHERRAHDETRRQLHAARDELQLKSRECEDIKARYEAALRGARVRAFSQDRDLRYTWIFNPTDPDASQKILGRTDDELGLSTEQESVIAAKRRVLATGQPEDTEAFFITPERHARFALHIEPVRSDTGEIEGLRCAAIDVSRTRSLEDERRRLNDELVAAAQRYELALRGSNVVVFTQDRNLTYTSVSKPIFGFDAAEVEGASDSDLLPSASAEEMIALKKSVLASGEARNGELRIETRGGYLWYDFHLEPMRDVAGTITGVTGAAVDITERKQGEAHLRLLLRELTHRSKNLLAVIQAMARQTAKHGGTVQSFVERFSERVQALARSHDLLVAESWRSVSLRDLVRSQLSYYIDRAPEAVTVEGPEIKLRPEAAQSLGLALHELAANAARFGAMSKAGGRVDISWRDGTDNDGFELVWTERGGPKVDVPQRRGFGSVAIEHNLARALDADVRLEFGAEGLVCRIAVPRNQLIANPES